MAFSKSLQVLVDILLNAKLNNLPQAAIEVGKLEKAVQELANAGQQTQSKIQQTEQTIVKTATQMGALGQKFDNVTRTIITSSSQVVDGVRKISTSIESNLDKSAQTANQELGKMSSGVDALQKKLTSFVAKRLELFSNYPELQKQADAITQHLNDAGAALKRLDGDTAKSELAKAAAGFEKLNTSAAEVKALGTQIDTLDKKIAGIKPKDLRFINNSAALSKELDAVKKSLDSAQTALNKVDGNKAKAELNKAEDGFRKLMNTTRDLQSISGQIDALEKSLDSLKPKDLRLIQGSEQLTAQLNTVKTSLNNAKTALNEMDGDKAQAEFNRAKEGAQNLRKGMDEARDAATRLKTNLDFSKEIGKAIQDFGKFGSQVSTGIRQIGQGLQSFGQQLTISITAPLLLAGKSFVESTANFGQGEAAMKAVTSQSDALAAGFQNVDDYVKASSTSILDWSKNYTFGAEAAMKTTLFVKEAGINNLQLAEKFAQSGADLSTATRDMNERTAAAYVSDTLKVVGVTRLYHDAVINKAIADAEAARAAGNTTLAMQKYDEAQKVVTENTNLLAIVANNSAGRFDQIIESITRYAPVATLLTDKTKQSREEIERLGWGIQGAAIDVGILMDKGIDTARGGTELATAQRTLFTSSEATLRQYGLSIFDATGKIKSHQEVLAQLNQLFFGNAAAMLQATQATEKEIKTNDTYLDSLAKTSSKISTVNKAIQDALDKQPKVTGSAATDAEIDLAEKKLDTAKQRLKEVRARPKATDSSIMAAEDAVRAAEMALEKLKAKQPKVTGTAPSPEEIKALQIAQDALEGDTAAVQKQTQALMANQAVFSKLPKNIRDYIISINSETETALKSQNAVKDMTKGKGALVDANGRLLESQRLLAGEDLFGAVGMKAAIPWIEAGTSAQDLYVKKLNEGGSAAEIAQKKMANFKDMVGKLGSSIESAMTKAFRPIIDKFLVPLVEQVQKVVDWFDKLDESAQTMIIGFLALAAALGPVLMAVGGLMFVFGMVSAGINQFIMIVGSLTASGMLAPAIAGIVALTTVVVTLGSLFAGVALALIDNTNGIRDQMKSPMDTINGYFKDMKTFFETTIPKAVETGLGALKSFGEKFLGNLDFPKIFTAIEGLRTAFGNLFKTIFGDMSKPSGELTDAAKKEKARLAQEREEWENKHRGQPAPPSLQFYATDDKFKSQMQVQAENFAGGLGKVLANISNVIVPGLIDAITRFTTVLEENLTRWKKIIDEKSPALQTSLENLGNAFGHLATALHGFDNIPGVKGIAGFLSNLAKMGSDKSIASAFDVITGSIDRLAQSLDTLATAIEGLEQKNIFKFLGAMADFGNAASGIKTAPNAGQKTMEQTQEAASQNKVLVKAILDSLANTAVPPEVQLMVNGIFELFRKNKQDVTDTVKTQNDEVIQDYTRLKDDLVGHSIVPDMINDVLMWFGKLSDIAAVIQTPIDTALAVVTGFTGKFETAGKGLMDSIKNGLVSAATGLKDALTKAVEDALNAVQGNIDIFFGNMPQSGTEGGSSGFGGPEPASKSGQVSKTPTNSMLGAIKGFAAGGIFPKGVPSVFGEKGPEILIPETSGLALNASMTQNLMGMISGKGMQPVNVTVNVGQVKDKQDAYFLAQEIARIIREGTS